jgi:hypothetical protein
MPFGEAEFGADLRSSESLLAWARRSTKIIDRLPVNARRTSPRRGVPACEGCGASEVWDDGVDMVQNVTLCSASEASDANGGLSGQLVH